VTSAYTEKQGGGNGPRKRLCRGGSGNANGCRGTGGSSRRGLQRRHGRTHHCQSTERLVVQTAAVLTPAAWPFCGAPVQLEGSAELRRPSYTFKTQARRWSHCARARDTCCLTCHPPPFWKVRFLRSVSHISPDMTSPARTSPCDRPDRCPSLRLQDPRI